MDTRKLNLSKIIKKKSKKEILRFIEKEVEEIWKNGIDNDCFDGLVDYFIDTDLDTQERKAILDSLLPRDFIISSENVEKLLIWLFSHMITDTKECPDLLNWMAIMTRFKLIDKKPIEDAYCSLIKLLRYEELIAPLCKLLTLITKPKMVNESNIFLATTYYKEWWNDKNIGQLLSLYYNLQPSLMPFKPKPMAKTGEKLNNFEQFVKKAALKQGISPTNDLDSRGSQGWIPVPEYDLVSDEEKLEARSQITNVSSMIELGRKMRKIILPDNEISLLTTNEGVMYLVANGPSQKFLSSLSLELKKKPSESLLISLVGLQEQLMEGLPPVTSYLADFLTIWDGMLQDQIVYGLIPWIHFNTFSELKKQILVPLARVFVSSSVEVKAEIIDSLTLLITNMMSVHMERLQSGISPRLESPKWLEKSTETVVALCEVVHQLLNTAIALEGMECNFLINQALSFYLKIIELQTKFILVCFIVVPPAIAYSALFSMNHMTLSRLCLLITKYKKEVIPQLASLGVLDQFGSEQSSIETMASDIYTYIWKEKDATDIMSGVESSGYPVEEQSTIRITMGIRHMGVFPLVNFLATHLKKNPYNLKKEDILLMLENYAKGMAQFIKLQMEEEANFTHQT